MKKIDYRFLFKIDLRHQLADRHPQIISINLFLVSPQRLRFVGPHALLLFKFLQYVKLPLNFIILGSNCQLMANLSYNMLMYKNIHVMGIMGSGVKGVADLASKMGYKVTGCDLSLYGHNKKHLKGIDLLVVSPAVLYQSNDEPELLEGVKKKFVMTWEEFLGKVLLKDKKVICVAGTHGKSTTTAMAAKMLIDAGFDPTVVLGAYVPQWRGNSRYGKGEYALVEADEFNNNFLHYHPEIAIITNIEFDHPDFFKNEKEVFKSFEKFKNQSKVIISKVPTKRFNLQVLGEHNQVNASFVYALGKKLRIPEFQIKKSIENFNGIGRRMELISDKNGIKIFDDYAHHPTAIKTTLEGLRKEFPKEKILTIIEPHGYKRTKALLKNYKGIFDSVDGVIIGPIFKARDEVDKSITPEMIAKTSRHPDIQTTNSVESLIENCKLLIDNCDYKVIVVMGAGESNVWAKKISQI